LSHLLVIGLIVVIAVVGLIVSQAQAAKRSRTLAVWAFSHKLDFSALSDKGLGNRYPHFECLNKGQSRYANNVMQGRVGKYRVCAFDYHYQTSDGKNKTNHRFSAVIVTTNLPLKPLVIRHTNLFDRLATAIGFEGIQFESTEFNKQFHVTSSDHRWAFDVLPQSTMEFLLDSPKFIVEFGLCQIIAYRSTPFQPTDFESAIVVIEGILQRLPRSLVQELQEN
jgi:hypothetical protein